MVFKAAANFTAGYQMNMNITFIDCVLIKPANHRGWLVSIKNLIVRMPVASGNGSFQ